MGCNVLSEIKAPYLNFSMWVPLVVAPSGKISICVYFPVVSIISCLCLIISTVLCRPSADPPLSTNIVSMVYARVPNKGTFRNGFAKVNDKL
jgi:hypothetical protein